MFSEEKRGQPAALRWSYLSERDVLFCCWLSLSVRPPPAGGLGRGRGLDPLQEGGGLAPLQEHLPGVVRHRPRGRPVQRRHHGPVRLRHPALRLRGWGRSQRGGRWEKEDLWKSEEEGDVYKWFCSECVCGFTSCLDASSAGSPDSSSDFVFIWFLLIYSRFEKSFKHIVQSAVKITNGNLLLQPQLKIKNKKSQSSN